MSDLKFIGFVLLMCALQTITLLLIGGLLDKENKSCAPFASYSYQERGAQ